EFIAERGFVFAFEIDLPLHFFQFSIQCRSFVHGTIEIAPLGFDALSFHGGSRGADMTAWLPAKPRYKLKIAARQRRRPLFLKRLVPVPEPLRFDLMARSLQRPRPQDRHLLPPPFQRLPAVPLPVLLRRETIRLKRPHRHQNMHMMVALVALPVRAVNRGVCRHALAYER